MKKLLIALVLGALLALAFSTLTLADNGPHGGFAASTDACASCHRAHSAAYGGNALLVADPEALCLSCHGGTGAGTNVEDGVYVLAQAWGSAEGVDGRSLLGGGFENALMTTAWTGSATASAIAPASRPTTSHHNVGTPGTIWGSGAANSANGSMVMECTSCHDPHGNAGWDLSTAADGDDVRVASYRLLRWQPLGSGGYTAPAGIVNWAGGDFPLSDMGTALGTDVRGWLVPDKHTGTEWYTIGYSATISFAPGDYTAGTALNSVRGGPSLVYNGGARDNRVAATNLSYFCAQCHDRYLANTRLRNNTDESNRCGTIDPTRPPLNGVTLTVNAPVGGLHPTDPTGCIAGTVTVASVVYATWYDVRSTGDTTYQFMHSSGDGRITKDGTTGTALDATTLAHIESTGVGRTCVACHVSHGTAAVMTANASAATLATGPATNNSVLLRLDNRGVCIRCHFGDVNFTLLP